MNAKRHSLFWGIFAVTFIWTVILITSTAHADEATEKAAIAAHSDKLAAAWNGADAKAMAATYVEDGVLIDPFGHEARGRAAIEQLFAQTVGGFLKGSKTLFTTEAVRFLKPDIAFVDATQTITDVTSPEGTAMPEIKIHVAISMVKQKGSWWFADGRPYAFMPEPGTVSKNVEKLRKAHEAWNARNFDTAMKLVAPTTKFTDHGRGQTITSRQEFREWLESLVSMSSDIKIVDAHYIDMGEWVIARFRVVGTQDGPVQGFPASNKPFSIDVCEVWHFNANGEADEGHNYSDGLGLLIQLGHIQPPR